MLDSNYLVKLFIRNLFSSSAFHILKDTTIQFTLEKVPLDEDTQFTFLTTEEPCKSTGLLRVEGKFVNPVQVYTYINAVNSQICVGVPGL